MKQIQTLVFCDNHPERPATHSDVVVTFGENRPRSVDLCELDYNSIVMPFLELLTKGVEVAEDAPDGRSDGKVACPLCETRLATRQGLSGHLRGVHQSSIKQLKREGIDV